MSIFLWTHLFLYALSSLMKLYWLVSYLPQRTRGETAADVAVNFGFIAWSGYLLLKIV
jgi:hypothetical protein